MTPDYKLCDHCGAIVPKEQHARIFVGFVFDGAETVNDYEHLDICGKCGVKAVAYLLNLFPAQKVGDEIARAFVSWFKEKDQSEATVS